MGTREEKRITELEDDVRKLGEQMLAAAQLLAALTGAGMAPGSNVEMDDPMVQQALQLLQDASQGHRH